MRGTILLGVSLGSVEHVVALSGGIRAQPQRDVGRLHRLPYHPYEVIAQGVQIRLVPELAEKASSVFAASYFLRQKRLSMKP